jgi:hypothetical protein
LRHLSFAKQRFDSYADPMAKLVLMLLPIACLLAYLASDKRNTAAIRERAVRILKMLTPKFVLAMGASADYALTSTAFLRLYDRSYHDAARTVSEFETFEKTMTGAFINGKCFEQPSDPASAEFITNVGRKQTRRRIIFLAGEEQIIAWGPCASSDEKEIGDRMSVVAANALERVRTELYGCRIRVAMQCLDLDRVRAGFTEADEGKRRGCLDGVAYLARRFSVDPATAVKEYRDAVAFVLARYELLVRAAVAQNKKASTVDHREAWGEMLTQGPTEICPGRSAPFVILPRLVRFGFALEDGECRVERDLADVTATAKAFLGAFDPQLANIVIVKGAAITRDQLCVERGNGFLDPTAMTLQWGRDWRRKHGARLGCYASRKRLQPAINARKAGTFNACKQRALKAAEQAGSGCTTRLVRPLNSQAQFLNGRAIAAHSRLRASPYWTQKQEMFLTGTVKKARLRDIAPLDQKQTAARCAAREMIRLGPVARVALAFEGTDADQAVASGCCAASSPAACGEADLVVVHYLATFFSEPPANAADVARLAFIVGLGKPVVSRKVFVRAKCKLEKLAPFSVYHHQPVAKQNRAVIQLERGTPEVVASALRDICGRAGARWRLLAPGEVDDAGGGEAPVRAGAGLGAWLQAQRRIINTRGPRAWNKEGERVA